MATNTNSCCNFNNEMDSFQSILNSMKTIENDVNTVEVEEVNELLKTCDLPLKGDNDNDLIVRYETIYDELSEFINNKRIDIEDVEKKVLTITKFTPNEKFMSILNKKKNNTNKIIDCINRVIERIKEKVTSIYKKRIRELDDMKVEKYGIDQLSKQLSDFEMNVINNSINVLKEWSNKQHHQIIFDSKIDGDGSNNTLHDKVLHKDHLYFITSDCLGNVFGGYLNETIHQSGVDISDQNAFVLSLTRNGEVKNMKYGLKSGNEDDAFYLASSEEDDWLYSFGNDIYVHRINDSTSFCNQVSFDYNEEQNSLTAIYPQNFSAQRIIVIQMD